MDSEKETRERFKRQNERADWDEYLIRMIRDWDYIGPGTPPWQEHLARTFTEKV